MIEFLKERSERLNIWKECKHCPFCGGIHIVPTRIRVSFGYHRQCLDCKTYFLVYQDNSNDFGEIEEINEYRIGH